MHDFNSEPIANGIPDVIDAPLTAVQRLVLRAALSEQEFTYFDLADLTGRSRENLRKIKAEVSARFPNVFVKVGKDEAEIGRKSDLWMVNPAYVDQLQQLTAADTAGAKSRSRKLQEFSILSHARGILKDLAGAESFEQLDMLLNARALLNRSRETLDGMKSDVSDQLWRDLDAAEQDTAEMATQFGERANQKSLRILGFLGEDENQQSVEPLRKSSLTDMVSYICHAPPGTGSKSVVEFDSALISSADDPAAGDSREAIASTMDDPTFVGNLGDATATTLRNSTVSKHFQRVAERLLQSFQRLRFKPDASLSENIASAADLEGLAKGLKDEALRVANMLQPRGRLAGQAENRPFQMNAEDRSKLDRLVV